MRAERGSDHPLCGPTKSGKARAPLARIGKKVLLCRVGLACSLFRSFIKTPKRGSRGNGKINGSEIQTAQFRKTRN